MSNNFKVTKIKFHFCSKDQSESTIANCDIEINGFLVINDLRLVKAVDGEKCYLPRRTKLINGIATKVSTVFFKDWADVQYIQSVVLERYHFLRSSGQWIE